MPCDGTGAGAARYRVVAEYARTECYYLNVMAGVGRVWNFSVDPAYAAQMNWQKIE
jgi:5-deoxy-D-glucuronate isomerase